MRVLLFKVDSQCRSKGMLPRKILNYKVSEKHFQPSESMNVQKFFFVEAINK